MGNAVTAELLQGQRAQIETRIKALELEANQLLGARDMIDYLLSMIDGPGESVPSSLPGLPIYKGQDGELHFDGIPEPIESKDGSHAS